MSDSDMNGDRQTRTSTFTCTCVCAEHEIQSGGALRAFGVSLLGPSFTFTVNNQLRVQDPMVVRFVWPSHRPYPPKTRFSYGQVGLVLLCADASARGTVRRLDSVRQLLRCDPPSSAARRGRVGENIERKGPGWLGSSEIGMCDARGDGTREIVVVELLVHLERVVDDTCHRDPLPVGVRVELLARTGSHSFRVGTQSVAMVRVVERNSFVSL